MMSKMNTKELILCTIVLIVGCLTSKSHSNSISSSAKNKNHFNNVEGIIRHHHEEHGNSVGFVENNGNTPKNSDGLGNSGDEENSGISASDDSVADDIDVNVLNSNNKNDDDDINDNDDDYDDDFVSVEIDDQLSLKDQVRMLTKQMSAIMQRRRDERNEMKRDIKAAIKKATKELIKVDIQSELDQLRHEIKVLTKASSGGTSSMAVNNNNKERLTIDWFSQAITEIRTELAELQEASSNTTRHLQQRNQCAEELVELRDDFGKLKLELSAIGMRQDDLDQAIKELKAEAIQRDEDFRRSKLHNPKSADTNDFIEPEADHRMRHQRFVRQHLHDLDIAQKAMKRQLDELHHHHIGERLHTLETEQKRLANANFNVSRQVASLDRLHGSMLELLEDIEGIQNKFDKTIPDIRREISKVEFSAAQVASEYNLLREEGHNAAKSIQALAVSVSTLQDNRDLTKQLEQTVDELKRNFTKLRMGANTHRHIFHKRIEKMESDSKLNASAQTKVINEIQMASKLVQELETVEQQYESIINKLPADCSQIEQNTTGLFMIAPGGQQHPILAHCINQWTTIQRRHDGSVDFNRSWDEYSHGFGTPSGEYWIGNDVLNHLTSDNCTSLKIVLQDIYDNTWEAVYSNFVVASRKDGYRLTISHYSGNASDAFEYQNHMQFSAIDVDRDISNTHCAGNYEGGWWFSHCQHANLNGRYNLGLTWFDASRNEWIAVKSSHMMISKRPNCALQYTVAPYFDDNSSSRSTSPSLLSSTTTTAIPDVGHSRQTATTM